MGSRPEGDGLGHPARWAVAVDRAEPGIERIGVVVPVHDEEPTLAACLQALIVAAAAVDVPVAVAVVLDACTDRSVAVASEFGDRGVEVMAIEAKCVGRARAAGMTELLRRHGEPGTWLATTDGDSTVPHDWLSAQLRHAGHGARVVAGTVVVDDWAERSDIVRDRAQREYGAATHRHVHGANLSFAADAYRAAGGFAPVPCHEDVQLVESLRANGESIAWATDLPVVTSARRHARAPLGFASYLTSLEETHQFRSGAPPRFAMGR